MQGMPPLRNDRQERFCQEYAKDQNGTRAAKAAGYSCASDAVYAVMASRLIRSDKVQVRLGELGRKAEVERRRRAVAVAERSIIDQAWVVNKLVTNVDRAMQAEPVLDRDGHQTGEWTYQGNVANKGLELIGKNLGMFQEKSPLAGALEGAQVNISVYLPQKTSAPSVIQTNGDLHACNGDRSDD
jgi:phage terminase small subunit